MDFVLTWSPLLATLTTVALALLLVATRPSVRRMALFVAGASLIALLLELMGLFVDSGTAFTSNTALYVVALALYRIGENVTSLLEFAAWVLLLTAAAQAGQRTHLLVLTIVFTLVLAFPLVLSDPQIPWLAWLRHGLQTISPVGLGETLLVALEHIGAVAALVCAFLLQDTPTETTITPPTPANS